MKKTTIDYARRDILKVARMTEDEKLIKMIWSCINGYFSKHKEDDPRNHVEKLGPEFWDSRDSEVNMYNVKSKLIENIELMPEDYTNDLKYLHRLYGITKFRLIEVANDVERTNE